MEPEVLCPPSKVDGVVGRVIARDGMAVSQIWKGGRWVDGGNIRSIEIAPPASPDLLCRLGIPS